MEEFNKYGNCWEDCLRRVDAENARADIEIANWAIQDAQFPELATNKAGYPPEFMRRSWEEHRYPKLYVTRTKKDASPKKKSHRPSRPPLKKSGTEMYESIVIKQTEKEICTSKDNGKKLVRRGKIKPINKHFK